ncbi:MAG: hypothetical protein LAKADJCE_00665 [Candidatus Argoarchaeum ethanivorans]|uniref:RiboL-PSP-HEPN domain-containing protein n=1 Tax=Candidatus Argoarchaeum ethanivorans TaxID=2608793 RepID=A0A811TCV7_9EURY|nr:MAG: hypothetical protein LAKADJCE_00665 [Candidatus Argoarchaeum ethanivorans]
MEKDHVFHRNCYEILRMGLDIESKLDFFISNYFCSPQSYKTFVFEDLILVEFMGFGRKIELFKKICKKENIDKERINKIVEAVRFVNNIRNRVAHDELIISNQKEGIKLQKRKSVQDKKDELKITDDLAKEVDERKLFSIQEIIKIHIELSNPSRDIAGW